MNKLLINITMNDINNFLTTRRKNPLEQIIFYRHNSVPTPTAQTTTPCVNIQSELNNLTTAASRFFADSKVGDVEKAVTWLMFQEGLRISEAIDIQPSDVLSNNSILIRAKKKSENKIIFPGRYSEFWKNYKTSKVAINETYNRFYFYRLFKKHSLYLIIKNNQHIAVTHSFRHLLIRQLQNDNIDRELRAKKIGHKNPKNQLYYENK